QLPSPPTLPFISFLPHRPPTPEIYTLSLHDALPIFRQTGRPVSAAASSAPSRVSERTSLISPAPSRADSRMTAGVEVSTEMMTRSEEHTSELQSRENLVCRLLLEKKKKKAQPKLHEI